MPVSDFSDHALLPTGSSTVSSLQFTMKYNCDHSGAIRSNYDEAQYSIRFVVNATTVYSTSGTQYWDAGSGTGTIQKQAYPALPTTTYHSSAIWYTLSAADVTSTGITSGVPFDITVDLKLSGDSVWTTVVTETITLTLSSTFTIVWNYPTSDGEELSGGNVSIEAVCTSSMSGSWTATLTIDGVDQGDPLGTWPITGSKVATAGWFPDITSYTLESHVCIVTFTETVISTEYESESTRLFTKVLGKATTPTPETDTTEVDFSDFTLSWVSGDTTVTHYNILMGSSGSLELLAEGITDTSYVTNLDDMETCFGTSPINQVIYWRVDSYDDAENCATGDEWNFDARPAKVTTPSPANAATGIRLFPTYGWTASTIADTYNLTITVS